jgi:hypothetical protein
MDTHPAPAEPGSALQRLVNREEVLQICYWFQGEGFGDRYEATALRAFLNCDLGAVRTALAELADRGALDEVEEGRYRFTEQGRSEGGRLFAESFSDFQRQGHGECDAGCCDGDDHSRCGDECALH